MKRLYFLHRLEVPPWQLLFISDNGGDPPCRRISKTKYMRKCRNWQTSKTKDLVIIAIVWVQVPSSALNNKTGTKQSVWSLSCCSKPKRALNPWFKVSPPARSARGMRSPGPHSPHLPQDYGRGRAGTMGPRSPLRFGRRRADIPRTSCNPSSARLRLLRGRLSKMNDKTGKVGFL